MSVQRIINLTFLACASLVAAFMGITYLATPTQISVAAPILPAAITQLTHDSQSALRPVWSPDNRAIAFESNRDGESHIYLMDPKGMRQRALTIGATEDHHPAWTSDGKSILYDSADATTQDIFDVNVTDGSRRQITHADGFAEYASMSPDGQRIAYYVYKELTLNIWTARSDGSETRLLTTDYADARRHEPTRAWGKPEWSPDSQLIAYTGSDATSIWVMHADGTNAQKVIDDGETNHFPWFLPDGRLAFITEYVPPKYSKAWTNLWTLDLHTGERTQVYERMSMQEPVGWNADLTKLIFASPRNGNFDIYLIDVNAPDGAAALQGAPTSVSAEDGL